MGEHSKIQWTHHTFNPWRGCSKVSPGCAHCYAERLSQRNPAVLGEWGDAGTRVIASESMWREPVKWNSKAKAAGGRHRVFCASLADVFEDRPELAAPRARLWEMVWNTPNLDWLLLTKRPENAERLWIQAALEPLDGDLPIWQPNLWLGTSVEDQAAADARIPALLRVPARVRFLSCEPLLGAVDLTRVHGRGLGTYLDSLAGTEWYEVSENDVEYGPPGASIDWVICGGESGPSARPMHPEWARGLMDQCQGTGVPFFFKQWGEWAPYDDVVANHTATQHMAEDPDDGGCARHRWPESPLRQKSHHSIPASSELPGDPVVYRVGVARSGRLLYGVEHSEFPEVSR